MTLLRCPHCRVPLAPGTIHHLRAPAPSVIVCRVVDVEANFAGLVGRKNEMMTTKGKGT